MKKITLLLLVCCVSTVFSQQIFVEGGKISSSFEFKNSQGIQLENLQSTTSTYLGIGYNHRLFFDDLRLAVGVAYNSYGAIGSDAAVSNYFEWDVDYVGLNVGLEYDAFQISDFSFYVKGSVGYEIIVQGTQTINNQVFNITGVEEFDDSPIFFRAGAGFSYPVLPTVEAYVQYLYGKSTALKDDTNNSNEELNIRSHMIGIGLRINIQSKDQEEEQETNTTESE